MADLQTRIHARRFKAVTTGAKRMEIALYNGNKYTSDGRIYVRVPGGYADGNDSVRNVPFPIRLDPGRNFDDGVGRIVVVKKDYLGRDYLDKNDPDDLRQAGINPRQFNANDPSGRYKPTSLLLDLQSFPSGGDGTVRVLPGIYRKGNGTYGIFSGQEDIEILSGYKPSSTNEQRVVALWLDTNSNSITITQSSTLLLSTDLKLNPATAVQYINECTINAPTGNIGIRSYIVAGTDTAISEQNMFHDLRGIIGGGAGHGAVYEPLTDGDTASPELIFASGDVIMVGAA